MLGMSIETPGDGDEIFVPPENFDINQPMELALQLQDVLIYEPDKELKIDFARHYLAFINQSWPYKNQEIRVVDYLIGPAGDDAENSNGIYRRAEGLSRGFSFIYADIDDYFGRNIYLTLLIDRIETVKKDQFETLTRTRQFHAPILGRPRYEILDVAS